MENEMKNCPFCGEQILLVAVKCKHCGSLLDGTQPQARNRAIDLGALMLVVPIIGALLVWFWVGSMRLIDNPTSAIVIIVIGTIIITALLAFVEASKANMVSDRDKGLYSPIQWFFLVAIFWVVGYPAYLFKRRHYHFKNLLVGAILVMIVFGVTCQTMNGFIDASRADAQSQVQAAQQQMQQAQQQLQQAMQQPAESSSTQ